MNKILLSLLALSLLSCKENSVVKKNKNNPNQETNIVEEVGSSKRIDPFQKNYRSNEGMVEDLYKQLILNDKELIKLDTKIKDLNALTDEVIGEYNQILDKSDLFYRDVIARTESISDSLLKVELDTLTQNSENNYLQSTQNTRNLISAAKNNIKGINDRYTAFKIKRTMLEIEKYQKNNTFDYKNLNQLITKQNQLLQELKSTK